MSRRLNPRGIAAPAGRYSHGIEIAAGARLLFVSGQVGLRPDGTTPSDPREQHDHAWTNIKAVLHEAGMNMAHLVRINGFITRADLIPVWRDARDRAMGEAAPLPASTLLVVSALARPEWVVEIEAVAAAE
jgi:enamine deaminase RidA (YjgF/YER057c/UK114 family)